MNKDTTIRIPHVTGTLAYVDLYEIVQDLDGASSPVYRAKKIGSRFGDVVVRPLPPGIQTETEVFGQIREAISRIASLRHPNIVPVQGLHTVGEVRYASDEARHRLGVGPGDILVVAEFAAGKRLDKWRAGFVDEAVPLDQAAEIVRQICLALDYAHRHDVLHLDLKPQNVKVERRSGGNLVARVMDFSPMPEAVGPGPGDTGAFMAPEVASGTARVAASDQFSAAMLFLWLMTGDTVRTGTAALAPTIRTVLERALDEDASARYATCGDFGQALVAAVMQAARGSGLLAFFRTMQALSPRVRRTMGFTALGLFAVAGAIASWNVMAQKRAAAKAEAARIARIEAERKAAAEKAAAEKAAREKAEAERRAREEAERKAREENERRLAAAKAEAERLAREAAERKAAEARIAAEEAARVAAEKRAAAAKAAAERAEQARREAERREAEDRAAEARRKATNEALDCFDAADWAGGMRASRSADMEDPLLLYRVGTCLLEGLGTVTNEALAVKMLSRAAEKGQAAAMARLADHYLSGTNVAANLSRALDLLNSAVAKGEPAALWRLSQCLANGTGVGRNPVESARLLRAAAEKDHPRAQYAMGLRTTDPRAAAAWFRRAAEQGYPPAQSRYGDCLFSGQGVARNVSEAVTWYARAAERGDARGQRALGWCYDNGDGVQEDAAKAVALYKSAAAGGDLLGKALLSQCYFLGMGVRRDYAEAGRLARESADGGNAFGEYMAGLCSETGNGAIRSRLAAKAWYEKAAAQGLDCARERLKNMKIR